VGSGWDVVEKYMSAHNIYSITGGNPEKIVVYRRGTFVRGIPVCATQIEFKIKDKNDVCIDRLHTTIHTQKLIKS